MRKVIGINRLKEYLLSVNYPITEEKINELIQSKSIPHLRPINNMIAFNLDHIDWWIQEQRTNT